MTQFLFPLFLGFLFSTQTESSPASSNEGAAGSVDDGKFSLIYPVACGDWNAAWRSFKASDFFARGDRRGAAGISVLAFASKTCWRFFRASSLLSFLSIRGKKRGEVMILCLASCSASSSAETSNFFAMELILSFFVSFVCNFSSRFRLM